MIRIEDISINLGEFFLKDLSLTVDRGEYLMILGPTGAGKTILLETIAGVYNPSHGRIYLNDVDITDMPPRKRSVGIVYQDYMLFPHLTVEKNIRFGLKTKKIGKEETKRKVQEIADFLGIGHLLHRHPGTLSGGEQQRVAIARALIIEPEVILLDEPLSALDSETRKRLRDELRHIHSSTSTTMIHVTHSFEEALLLGSKMAIMNQGAIVQSGVPGDVFRKPNCQFSAEFLGVGNMFSGQSVIADGVADVAVNGLNMVSSNLTDGQVYVSIRPEDILISLAPIESSARNSFKGAIIDTADLGALIRVTVDVGIDITAAITRRSFIDMGLKQGTPVHLTFKATDVHIF